MRTLPRPEPDTLPRPHEAPPTWPRSAARALLLAAVCAGLQALQPAYTLGSAALVPLGLLLGVLVAAALTRGPAVLPGALAGVVLAQLWAGAPPEQWVSSTALLGLQAMLAVHLMRRAADPGVLMLDSGERLKRLVLLAAPAAALLGAVGSLATNALANNAFAAGSLAAGWSRAGLAHALGRLVVDGTGIVLVCAVLLCWLARPVAHWRPRRRLVAAPLLLIMLVMLPGLDQVARRDELRLQVRFEQDALARQRQLQQLLTEPVAALAAARGILAAGGPSLGMAQFDLLASDWTTRVPGLRALGWLDKPTGSGGAQLGHAHAQGPGSLALLAPGQNAGQLPPAAQQAAARAAAGNNPVSSRLAGDQPTDAGALLLLQRVPSAGDAPTRLAFALLDLQDQLATALPDNDDPNLRVCVFDNPPAGSDDGLAAANARSANRATSSNKLVALAGPAACAGAPSQGAFRTQAGRLSLSERPLALLSIEPPTADNRLFTAVWLLGLPTVLGTAMLATLLLALTGRMRRIEDRVQERTAELQSEVDERRQTQQALVQSEQRFRAIFESVNIGVTLVDNHGLIQMANPAFGQMMGLDSAAVVGQPLARFKLPDVAQDDGTAQALGGGQARRQRYLSADGQVLQVAASVRQLYDNNGLPVATVGALHELTQVLRLREAERARDEADIANRTKSDFLSSLSHELRTPLNAIVGFAQLLDDTGTAADGSPVDPARLQHSLAQIRQAGWHLLDMVNDVLDLSRLEAGTLRLSLGPVALPEVAQEALAMMEASAQQAEVKLTLSLSPQAEWAQADTLRLRQILINLLGNAIKYNRPGGQVTLRTRPAGAGELRVEVEDNCPGIAPDQIEALFKPFHRLGRDRGSVPHGLQEQGTGIGLVICRRLAELMGGAIEVSSQPGEGSVFALRLPMASAQGGRSEVLARSALGAPVSIGQALYIEDNPADVAAMRTLLAQRPGITLQAVGSAAQGLAQAASADVLLLDLDLPDQPGLALLRTLRSNKRLKRMPVIVVSAETRPERIDACFDAGATAFLSKPLDPGQLLRALDEALQQA